MHTLRWVSWGIGLCLCVMLASCNRLSATVTPPTITPSAEPAFATATDIAPTSAIVRTSIPTPVCEGLPPSRLIVHERAQVIDDGERLNLREEPGTDYDILARIDSGSLMFVLDGPTCGTDYVWFRVRYEQQTGWIAEGESGEYYAQPYLPG